MRGTHVRTFLGRVGMDVPLYAIALVVFAVLYLGIGVFLAYTLVITLIIMFLYLAMRYGKLPDNYPSGLGDSLITIIFIGVTWGIFTFLAPKSPIPFIGTGLTYTASANIPVGAFVQIAIVLALVFLVIGAFIANDLQNAAGGSSAASSTGSERAGLGGEKPKQGVGA